MSTQLIEVFFTIEECPSPLLFIAVVGASLLALIVAVVGASFASPASLASPLASLLASAPISVSASVTLLFLNTQSFLSSMIVGPFSEVKKLASGYRCSHQQ